MGRRSTKTTKTGKFMNPTDQWRKQQRRKELKKNKKQRQTVREAVLKMKDVAQLLEEIEEIEKLQMTSITSNPVPNDKGLEEKKEKLHMSVNRVAAYYQGEDPKKAEEIRFLIMESEKRRRQMSSVYRSYRAARSECSIDQIPLPSESILQPSDIPMPSDPSSIGPSLPPGLVPPGPPPGSPPPDLPNYHVVELQKKSVRFAPKKNSESDAESDADSEKGEPPGPPLGAPPTLVPPPIHPAPSLMLGGMFPPPPPGIPPPFPPPAPPPKPLMPPSTPHIQSGAVLSVPSSRPHHPPTAAGEDTSTTEDTSARTAVISAQPQLRNMTAEVTKFMPTSLRVRRNHPKPSTSKLKPAVPTSAPPIKSATKANHPPTQGDAYDAFMREMQGLF